MAAQAEIHLDTVRTRQASSERFYESLRLPQVRQPRIADVGQDSKEEINRVSKSELGANFGWNIKEGTEAFNGSTVATLTDPVHEWDNLGGSSAIGGFVYRGSAIKELQGKYLFADFAESGIFLFDPSSNETTFIDLPISKIVGFGEDANGEIFLLSLSSGVFALLPAQ